MSNIINISEPKTFNLTPIPNFLENTYYNSIGLTPPMGWNSWNFFYADINENIIIDTAKAIKKSGLADLGYIYINLDDGWEAPSRDVNGRLQLDSKKFPNGINYLVKAINNLGLKLGIYSCNGTVTCEKYLASLNNEYVDAQTFADWGIEYLKYDYCFNTPISTTAPSISNIYIKNIANTTIASLTPSNAQLYLNAKIITYNTPTSTPYITGLSSKGGYAEFKNIIAPSSGTYEVSIQYKGTGYFELTTNYGQNIYCTSVTDTSNSSSYSTLNMNIFLNAGTNNIMISNPVNSKKESAKRQYLKMGNALKEAANLKANKNNEPLKEIYFSICEWGENQPWEWARTRGNCWRTTGDIKTVWDNYPDHGIVDIYNVNSRLYNQATIGGFNDPDMLEVGNGNFTVEEYKSHFTLWCMMAAPLILGNDIRTFIKSDGSIDTSNTAYKIITNKDLINIDQDSKGIQGRIFKTDGNIDVLVRPLYNNDIAICFFNKGMFPQSSSINLLDLLSQPYISLPKLPVYKVFDLWDKSAIASSNTINVNVPSHGIKSFRIGKYSIGEIDKNQELFLNVDSVLETSSTIKVTATFQNTGKETINNITLNLQVPNGFKVTSTQNTIATLLMGQTFNAQWTLTLPSTKGTFSLSAVATFKYNSSTSSQTLSTTNSIKVLNTVKPGDTLTNIDFISATTGYGSIQYNKSVSGNPLTINGKAYSFGLGTHANSEIKIFTGRKPIRFSAIVGIDDEESGDPLNGFASALFQVWGDNKKLFDSGIMRYKESNCFSLDLTNYNVITLKSLSAKDSKDNIDYDHCDWANASFKNIDSCNN
ncbi:MAG: NPCBM/NEW2 domain-containing protein [Sarcina sp.]